MTYFLLFTLASASVDAFSVFGTTRQAFHSKMIANQKQQSALAYYIGRTSVSHQGTATLDRLSTSLSATLEVQLEKPLGMILEEIEEGAPKGVFVKELAESGSAFASQYKNQLVGSKILSVSGSDMTALTFDQAMEAIIEAPSPLVIEFEIEEESAASTFDMGTPVTVTVMQEGKDTLTIDCRVGENLRKTLLDNNVELYRGLKKKLGNCGGGGQCTFCAVKFVEEEGWAARSEYEDTKVGKQGPNVRLACLNNIQGPCTVQVA